VRSSLFLALLKKLREKPEKFGLNGASNSHLCNAGVLLHQLSYQDNWELVVIWVDDNPIDDKYRSVHDE